MRREARIILPCFDNKGTSLENVKRVLEIKLAQEVGGYTLITSGRGSWMNGEDTFLRQVVTETVWVFDIAVHDNAGNNEALRCIAVALKDDAKQDAIYLRLPNGEVHFV